MKYLIVAAIIILGLIVAYLVLGYIADKMYSH